MATTNNFLDKTGLALVWSRIKLLLVDKVDKVDGKGLSSNDFTNDEKAKLATIESGAEANVNADWNAVTGDAAILNRPTIPSKTSDLTNDSDFVTSTDVDTAISEAISDITSLSFSVVNNLPPVGENGVVYLIADTHSDDNDAYDEYVWLPDS